MADEDQTRMVLFCAQCFATSEGGSWGGGVVGDHPQTFCTNCSCEGTSVPMSKLNAETIRRQASWIGKRYYPADEDMEIKIELRRLRRRAGQFYGRTAESHSEPGLWTVWQRCPYGRSTGMQFRAASAEEAIEASREHLPFFTKEDFA